MDSSTDAHGASVIGPHDDGPPRSHIDTEALEMSLEARKIEASQSLPDDILPFGYSTLPDGIGFGLDSVQESTGVGIP